MVPLSLSSKISTGRLAGACARHPWRTIGIWLVIAVLAAFAMSRLLSSAVTTEIKFTRPIESQQAYQMISDRLKGPEKSMEIVVVSTPDLTVDDPAYKAQVERMGLGLIALAPDVISGGTYYYQAHDESLVSADRHTTLIPIIMAGTLSEAQNNISKVRQVTDAAAQSSGFMIVTTGTSSANADFNQLSESDLRKAELLGIPIAMLILLVVFGSIVITYLVKRMRSAGSRISVRRAVTVAIVGSFVAALLPLLLAAFSIVIAIGITSVVGQRYVMSFFVENMITMMGLAVGIDYSLFVVSRYLEELINGRDKMSAIEKAGSTASRAVLFSGMTVILALAGMLIVPISLFYSLAAGAMFVVAVSVAAALTLLPAILSLLGNPLSMPGETARAAGAAPRDQVAADAAAGGRFWDWITRTVMRQPVVSALLAGTLLIVPALFYFQLKTGANGVEALPDSYPSKQGYTILNREFSYGLIAPAEVVIDGDVNSQPVKDAIARLEQKVSGDPAFYGAPKYEANSAGDLAVLSLPMAAAPDTAESTGAVTSLRQQYVPAAFEGVDARVLVDGSPAFNLDYFSITDDYRPIVFAFVLGLSFLLLMVVFHSLVVPLKAIIMNMLSVGAAYGLIVLVFQKGIGNSLFGFQQVNVVEAWVPLFLFSVLFGLSMDYHVFLLGRIREHYLLTGDNTESVATGLRTTGKIITGAALIMVVVFSGFASGQLVMFQQMGFGLAVAVLLDATVVRTVLVPSTMELLGDWNWYLPRWLSWLPDFRMGQGE
ncbi:MAG: MMPL family transporter [Thermoleophilia bacterium]